jgi:hypothetical protein
MLTLTAQVHAAEGGRPELFAPLYGFALLCFFLYCYPINRKRSSEALAIVCAQTWEHR